MRDACPLLPTRVHFSKPLRLKAYVVGDHSDFTN
ncbi:hypothetical protein KL86PLE_100184 [uncultured Pleomorphomonas sp.]|uniref:Uncharacterized protein n=1 Tax=uncultured Pleomorphomonas sp. TaxID=442121 RepID=A0A212L1M0_9HYPH|nr:hypothetical protein KL86PLE_100184 [uncultured Pleomorphomonas sp.]